MKARSLAWSVVAPLAVIIACASSGAAVAQTPIAAKQHFVGMVNGVEGHTVVYTVCPGPATKHRRGPVQGGQTLAVAEVPHGHGYTGPLSSIYAWFQPVAAGKKPVMLNFTQYGVPQRIPRSVRVPCDGKGKVVFSSCPYLAPCPAGWVPNAVRVKFENIAASPANRRVGQDR